MSVTYSFLSFKRSPENKTTVAFRLFLSTHQRSELQHPAQPRTKGAKRPVSINADRSWSG